MRNLLCTLEQSLANISMRGNNKFVPAGNAELLPRAFAGAIPTLCHSLLAMILIFCASEPTLGSLLVWKLLLSTVDCVRPFASTFNIPSEVFENWGGSERSKGSSGPNLFHEDELECWPPGWLSLFFGKECWFRRAQVRPRQFCRGEACRDAEGAHPTKTESDKVRPSRVNQLTRRVCSGLAH